MRETRRIPGHVVPICPACQNDLTFVASWTFRGLWGYNEVRTYECATHGPVFLTPEVSIGVRPDSAADKAGDDADRDALIAATRTPTPTPGADAVALPEPDSD